MLVKFDFERTPVYVAPEILNNSPIDRFLKKFINKTAFTVKIDIAVPSKRYFDKSKLPVDKNLRNLMEGLGKKDVNKRCTMINSSTTILLKIINLNIQYIEY